MFSAYTVKKIVPRLLIAAVMIQLSWWVVIEIININNQIAHGIEGLMYAPFGGIDNFLSLGSLIQSSGSVIAFEVTSGVFLAAAASASFVSGGGSILGILALAATAALGLLIGLFTLVLRQAVLLFLVIISPVAIVAWVLPGTERFWKLWWETFSKLLLVYPLVLMAIAAGRIFAYVSAASGGNQMLSFILVVLGFFGPLFMIPAMLKLAGSIFTTVTGMVNDRGKGAFDRLRNARGKAAESAKERRTSGNTFRNASERGVRGTLNRGIQKGILAPKYAGLDPRRMRANINSAVGSMAGREVEELLEKNDDIKAVKNDDDLARAAETGRTDAEIERELTMQGSRWAHAQPAQLAQAVALVKRAQRAGSNTAVSSAMSLARAQSGTGFDTSADMQESILRAAGGDRMLEGQLLAAARSASERARRPDLATAGHVDQAQAMDRLRATMGDPESAAHQATRHEVNSEMRRLSFRAGGAHAILSGRTASVQAEMVQLGQDYQAAVANGNVAEATELASQITSVRGAMGNASPDVRQAVTAMLGAASVDISAVNPATGQAYSVDEQLGQAIGTIAGANAQAVTQEIRTRAGAYDAGGGNLTPEQIRAQRGNPAGGNGP